MDVNIAGLVVDTNYQNDISGLAEQMEIGLVEVGTTTLGALLKTEPEHFDWFGVVFTTSGLMLICQSKMIPHIGTPAQGNCLKFAVMDQNNFYAFAYVQDGKTLREVADMDGERLANDGLPQSFETSKGVAAAIWAGIEAVIGQSFASLPPETKATIFQTDPPDPHEELYRIAIKLPQTD